MYLQIQSVADRNNEVVGARNELESVVALYHAGQIRESPSPNVEVLVKLRVELGSRWAL